MCVCVCVSPVCSAGRMASRLSSTPHHLQQGMTLAFLENQLASTLTLGSGPEYHHWLIVYTRFLVNEGEQRLLCRGFGLGRMLSNNIKTYKIELHFMCV